MPRLRFSQIVAIGRLCLLVLSIPVLGFTQTAFDVPFTYQVGGSVPTPADYDIFSPTVPLSLTLKTDGAAWVSGSLNKTITPAVLTITVSPGSLQAGTYTSTLEVDSSQGYLLFHVTLTVTGGSASAITLSPSAFTFNAAAGGAAPASQTLTVSMQTSTSASAQASKQSCTGSNWLTLAPSGSFTAGPTNTTFTVSADPSGLAAGTTCSGTITITAGSATQTAQITLNVTGQATGPLALSPSAFTFNSVAGGTVPAAQALTVTAQTNTSATVQVSQQSCTGSTWLTLSPTGSFTAGPTNATFTVSVSQAGIAGGTTCSGTISIKAGSATQTANVTLNVLSAATGPLTLSSSAFTFNGVAGGNAPAAQTLTVTAQPSTSASAQVSEQSCTSRTWLALSPSGSFTAGQTNTNFTISINLTGLAGGTTCSGTISLTAGSSTQTVPVTLNVANSTTGTLAFSPTAVAFNASAGGAAPPSQTLTVTAPTFASSTAQVSKQSCTSSNWLILSPTDSFIAGPTTTNFSVSVNQSGLAAGTTCSGTISMTAGSVTQTVPVTMNVIAVTPGVLTLSAPGITFSAVAGGSAPDAVTFTVTSSTFTSATAQISLQTCTTRNWLTLSPIGDFTAGPTPKTFTVTADSSGMAGGTTCIGSITMTSPTGTQTVPVTLNAISTASSVLTLSASALTFSAAAGGAAPSAQTFTVTANFDTSAIAQASKQNCGTSDWLALSPTGSFTASVTETTFTVSVDPSGIAAGTTCSGTILVNAATGARRVSVTLSVVELPGPVLTVFPSAITFNAVAGGAAPIAQAFTVTAKTDVHASAKAVEASCTNSNWLTLPQSGNFVAATAAATFTVSVDPSGIAAGTTCSGSIVISSFTESQTVSVSMIVAAPSGGGLTVTPTTLTFSFSAGDPTPASQVVTISGGGAAVPFVVVPSSSGWLQVSPSCTGVASCTTPNTGTFNLVVTASPTGLNTGTYFGSIGVSGTGLNAGSTNVNVSFTVKAPQPIISGVTNGSSFVSGPVAPGELIAIFANSATPIGPAIALKAGDATCPAPCTNLPTTMGGAQVIFQPGGIAAPLTYVSSTQITCVVPYEIAGAGSVPGSPIQLEVKYLGQSSNPVPLQYAPTQPGIFTALGTGTGLASVQQFDEQGTYQGQNSGSNPAKAGWHLTFYVTGEGMIPAPAITGKITVGADVIPLLGPPSVTIDGLPSAVSYFGEAAGFVSGMMQVNATVPAGVHTGQAVSLSLSMSGNSSQPGVTIYVK